MHTLFEYSCIDSIRFSKNLVMKKNMGGTDRIIRLVVAAIVAVLFFTGVIQGTLAYILIGLAEICIVN